ncbi:sensor histidine kinase [Pseudodesulfovibrio sediminis]|uniref:histidine kinase n=1 Tax=Pseudodesulfovibrio sediminis TaxID=2810563 RepID=A0ABM7P8Y0_9BACT|nr:HAMP domain-containing sensor histidine kinase [Pseudodesulfovibrio sediminis]BCS89881.1 two-component sensor histidine kinase [Pseudodesulfovibrio sediminis]
MKCRKSFKKSIVSYFVITCAVLVIGYSIFLSQYLTRGFSLFVEFRLEEVAGSYLEALATDPGTPLPSEGPIKGYMNYQELPAEVRAEVSVKQLKSERFTYIHKGDNHYKILVIKRADQNIVFLLFSATEGHMTAQSQGRFDFYYFYTPALAGFLALLTVLFLAFRLFNHIAKPVEKLHEWAIGLSPENLDKEPIHFKYDELTAIADLVLNTSRRLVARTESEKRFQKHASHELRTPIAILQNNLELLELQGITEDTRYQASHARMVKAVRNMRNLTTSLLWLSREPDAPLPAEDIDVDDFVREIIDENVYLLEGKNVSITTDLATASIRVPRTLAHIILVNLIRNAFQHSYEGQITIKANQTLFEISNLADPPSENTTGSTDGYGLGLQLSIQLVEKIGWNIQIREEDGRFLVQVDIKGA